MKLQNRCRIFSGNKFFFIPLILIAQSDDLEGKLKAQEEQLKEKSSQKKTQY